MSEALAEIRAPSETVTRSRRPSFRWVLLGTAVLLVALGFVLWLRFVEPYQRQRRILADLRVRYEVYTQSTAPDRVHPWLPEKPRQFYAEFFSRYTLLDVRPYGYISNQTQEPGNLSMKDARNLAGLPFLNDLCLSNLDCDYRVLGRLMRHRGITVLAFRDSVIEGDATADFPEMPQLKHLDFNCGDFQMHSRFNNDETRPVVSADCLVGLLGKTPGLVTLYLHQTYAPGETERFMDAVSRLDRLEQLNLRRCGLTDEHLARLKGLTRLTSLELMQNTEITDAGIRHLEGLTALRYLDLSSLKGPTNEGLKFLAGMHELEWLELSGTDISAEGIAHLTHLPRLSHLELSGKGDRIDDEAMKQVAKMSGLRVLWIGFCPEVTDTGLEYLEKAPSLNRVFALNCGITPAGIERFQKARSDCQVKRYADSP